MTLTLGDDAFMLAKLLPSQSVRDGAAKRLRRRSGNFQIRFQKGWKHLRALGAVTDLTRKTPGQNRKSWRRLHQPLAATAGTLIRKDRSDNKSDPRAVRSSP